MCRSCKAFPSRPFCKAELLARVGVRLLLLGGRLVVLWRTVLWGKGSLQHAVRWCVGRLLQAVLWGVGRLLRAAWYGCAACNCGTFTETRLPGNKPAGTAKAAVRPLDDEKLRSLPG